MGLKKFFSSSAFFHAVKIALIYAVLGTLWIIFSDRLPAILSLPIKNELLYQSVKGIVYVVVSAGVIFLLVLKSFSSVEKINRQLKESQRAYKKLSDYQSAIIASSPVAIFDTDEEGRVLSIWNDSAVRIFGCDKEEVLGEPFFQCLAVKEDYFTTIERCLCSGVAPSGVEIDATTRAGEEKSFNISCSHFNEENGNNGGILWVIMDVTTRKRAQRRIEASLKEKEILLQEINHRVYNNLQTISSILSLQQEYAKHPEAVEQISESKNRILSLAMVHEELYQNLRDQGDGIEIGSYIHKLAQAVFLHYRADTSGISMYTSLEPCVLPLEKAVPLGLLVRELISNALRHAFTSVSNGVVRIVLSIEYEEFSLTIADNGNGLDEKIDLSGTKSLGFSLIDSLIRQLEYSIEVRREGGTSFIIRGNI